MKIKASLILLAAMILAGYSAIALNPPGLYVAAAAIMLGTGVGIYRVYHPKPKTHVFTRRGHTGTKPGC